ncbi:MAG: DUF455 family protein [Kofleriaceae bacterium]|nr:DUF455 family protein [Myxococcales bacterium]MCB9565145.1 DUF455 family protein [Kofleriaceae bacterium]MCB9572206.1 DUF455 family protein [Kofleriaceae bacterium]
MHARAYARALLDAETLEGKLAPPPAGLELDDDGPPELVAAPRRPASLQITHHRKVSVPPIQGMRDPAQRARIIHALANHELQAVELFAWAVLAFPDAPRPFRAGLIGIIADEQRHFALYAARLAAHGVGFGDHPVTGHFWNRLPSPPSPLRFLCAMGLTFEQANLDFAGEYARAAREVGDDATAEVLDQVHADEIGHVRFAWRWVETLAPDADPWDTYRAHVEFPLGPARARGRDLDVEARRAAGISDDFIARLEAIDPRRPGGGPR